MFIKGFSHQPGLDTHETSGGGSGKKGEKINREYGLVIPITLGSKFLGLADFLSSFRASFFSPVHFALSLLLLAIVFHGKLFCYSRNSARIF